MAEPSTPNIDQSGPNTHRSIEYTPNSTRCICMISSRINICQDETTRNILHLVVVVGNLPPHVGNICCSSNPSNFPICGSFESYSLMLMLRLYHVSHLDLGLMGGGLTTVIHKSNSRYARQLVAFLLCIYYGCLLRVPIAIGSILPGLAIMLISLAPPMPTFLSKSNVDLLDSVEVSSPSLIIFPSPSIVTYVLECSSSPGTRLIPNVTGPFSNAIKPYLSKS